MRASLAEPHKKMTSIIRLPAEATLSDSPTTQWHLKSEKSTSSLGPGDGSGDKKRHYHHGTDKVTCSRKARAFYFMSESVYRQSHTGSTTGKQRIEQRSPTRMRNSHITLGEARVGCLRHQRLHYPKYSRDKPRLIFFMKAHRRVLLSSDSQVCATKLR